MIARLYGQAGELQLARLRGAAFKEKREGGTLSLWALHLAKMGRLAEEAVTRGAKVTDFVEVDVTRDIVRYAHLAPVAVRWLLVRLEGAGASPTAKVINDLDEIGDLDEVDEIDDLDRLDEISDLDGEIEESDDLL